MCNVANFQDNEYLDCDFFRIQRDAKAMIITTPSPPKMIPTMCVSFKSLFDDLDSMKIKKVQM